MGQLSPTNLMSSAWLPAYEENVLQPVAYAEIWSAFNYVTGGGSLLLGSIPVVSGSVTIDRNNVIRRQASGLTFNLDNAGLLLPVANANDGLFSPYGNELRLYKGCKTSGGASAATVTAMSAPSLPYTVTSGVNDRFIYTPASTGIPDTFTVAPGTYSTLAALESAIEAAVDSGSNVFSTYCTVTDNGTDLIITAVATGIAHNGDTVSDVGGPSGYPTVSSGNDGHVGNPVVVPAPAGITNGDCLMAFAYNASGSGSTTVTPPSGWTQVDNENGGNDQIWLFTKTASSEPSSYTWTFSDPYSAVIMLDYPPATVDTDVGDNNNSASVVTSPLTVTDNDELILLGAGNYGGDTLATPAGLTYRESDIDSGNQSIYAFDGVNATTSVPSFTGAWTAGANYWASIVVGLILASSPSTLISDMGFGTTATLEGGSAAGVEYAQLGVYCIGEVVVNDDGTGVSLVGTLSDRSQWISRRGFATPFSISGAIFGPVGDFIQAILGAAMIADHAFTYVGAAWSTGSNPCPYVPGTYSWTIGDDPWQACCDVAAAAGLELYFDYEGNLVLDYVPDPSTITPCVSYLEGTSTAPVSIARDLSNVNVPNVICVMSQGSSVTAPLMVWWWDSNPSSETYFAPGPIGGFDPTNPQYTLPGQDPSATYPQMIQEFDSNLIGPTFQAEQAQALAIAIGLTSIGSIEAATFTIRDQPAHDVDDVITFQRVVAGIPASTNYVVDQVQIDMTPQTAESLATRLIAA